MKMAQTIGFVGLGIMGKGMLRNLATKLQAPLIIWNRSPDILNELKSEYGDKVSIAGTAADVIKNSDVTYCMLSTEEASKAVFDGENGILSAVSPGKVIVDCATLSPERMKFIDEKIKAAGGRFMEAPVSGSKLQAEGGVLIFLCGGDKAVFDECSEALDAMGKAKHFLGDVGKGSEMKLVVNMIMGTMMSSLAEGMSLAKASDLSQTELVQILDEGAMSCPMFKTKGPKMAENQFPTQFPLKHQQKDMRLALALAKNKGVTLPTANTADENYKKVLESNGDDDFSAVLKSIS